MKARITHYNHIVRITYDNGVVRTTPFAVKKNAEQFAKSMQSGCSCKVEIISK